MKTITLSLLIVSSLLILLLLRKMFSLPKKERCSKNIEYVIFDSGITGPYIGIVGSMHGNEPAGSITLQKMIKRTEFNITKGKLIVIVKANPCGLDNNTRVDGDNQDINRSFDKNINKNSKFILELIKNCDIVVDLHEGFSFYSINKESLGSTISPSNHKVWENIIPYVLKNLNRTYIKNQKNDFVVLYNRECEITSSLSCWCFKNNIPYLLVETSGQDDIQPINIRVDQMRSILQDILFMIY